MLVNQTLAALSLEKHPAKTFIGRIERRFDFLGYHFSTAGMKIAAETIANFSEKASRLHGKSAARIQPARHSRCTPGGGYGGRRADA
jgi:hypothetical protein